MSKVKLTDVELDIGVDENRLDEEWVRQPRLFHRYSVELADARMEFDEAKADLEVIQADLDRDVRENPINYAIEKLSEKRIEAVVTAQEICVDSQKVMNEAKHKVAIFQAAVNALDQKRAALENLVKLRLADYYSEPKARDVPKEEVDNMKAKARGRRVKRRREGDNDE